MTRGRRNPLEERAWGMGILKGVLSFLSLNNVVQDNGASGQDPSVLREGCRGEAIGGRLILGNLNPKETWRELHRGVPCGDRQSL